MKIDLPFCGTGKKDRPAISRILAKYLHATIWLIDSQRMELAANQKHAKIGNNICVQEVVLQ